MPVRLQNITDEPHQRHIILFADSQIELILRFHPTAEMWCFDATYKTKSTYGHKLSTGVLHIESTNFPFDFMVSDLSGNQLDPFKRDDFSSGRCALYMFDAEDMEALRGGSVPI